MGFASGEAELERERRNGAAKVRLAKLLQVSKLAYDGESPARIAVLLGVHRETAYRWLRWLGWVPQPNGKPRKPFEAMPWRRAIGARGGLP